jgi:glycosyltransferase involved in cell wall biosynthesis
MSTLEAEQMNNPVATAAPRRIRVMHLVSTLNIGGLEKVVYNLVRLADHRKFDLQVACLGEIGALAKDFEALNIPVHSLGVLGRGTLRSALATARFLRQHRPDILHTHNPTPHLVGALAAKTLGIPVLHTKHGRNYPGQWKKVLCNRIATWLTRRVIAVSNDAADVARQIERVPVKKVEVLFNGIDLERFRFANQSQPRDPRRAIHVARLSRPKDHATLLQAARIVADAEPAFHLDIVGDGPERAPIEQLRADLKLEPHVTLHGFRHDVSDLLTHCGIFLLSSNSEGLSITILEAMANSLPVITTHVGGSPEVVGNNRTGMLIQPRSPHHFANAILQLIRNPHQAGDMGRQARLEVEARFDARTVAKKYESYYRNLFS